MSYWPPGQCVVQEFRVFRDVNGRQVAAETHGLPGGVFSSGEEAVRFALWQVNGEATSVHLEPSGITPRY